LIAQDLATQETLDFTLRNGAAANLPFADASFEAVLSGFAVILAPDPHAAATEMLRVLTPEGAIGDMNAAALHMVLETLGAPEPPPAFPWHQVHELTELLSGIRPALHVQLEEHELAFTAASPEHYLDINSRHPLAVTALGILEQAGKAVQARSHLLAILQAGNEDPAAFRSTSRYVIAKAT
jgi:SAM-dependent methyltransferase